MIDENRIVGELKKQHTNLLDFIDKLELSHEVKMELLEGLQSELSKRSLKAAYEYGVKVGINNKEIATPTATPDTPSFSEAEESVIKKYVDYFKQNGLETSIPSVSELSPRDKELIEEATRRVNEEYADTFAQYVSPETDNVGEVDSSILSDAASSEDKPIFTDEEENFISVYTNYFRENGLDAPIHSVTKLPERTKELINEAMNRVAKENEGPHK
ncbi:MAG: hypothetical protein IKQ35_03610 [Bacilli bacterium]|nr:hypothetical protein [Bacilli bacterium]